MPINASAIPMPPFSNAAFASTALCLDRLSSSWFSSTSASLISRSATRAVLDALETTSSWRSRVSSARIFFRDSCAYLSRKRRSSLSTTHEKIQVRTNWRRTSRWKRTRFIEKSVIAKSSFLSSESAREEREDWNSHACSNEDARSFRSLWVFESWRLCLWKRQ